MPRSTETVPDKTTTLNDPIYGLGTTTSYTGTAGTCATLDARCNAVFVWCSTAAYVKVGVSPTATTADLCLPAGLPIALPVHADGSAVSAVQVASGGSLYVTQLYR